MAKYHLILALTCAIASAATNNERCQCPTSSAFLSPGNSASIGSRIGAEMNTAQQLQLRDLYCLEVLDKLLATEWQTYIDRVSVQDIGNFSTLYKIPQYDAIYSNPESEWILKDQMAYNKLDKCFRNLISKTVPRMDPEEIQCLNRMFPDYMGREIRTARDLAKYEKETSREQLPFKTFYTYYEITEILFQNRNIDALDDDQRAVYEDMNDFYIKSEEDKNKKIFIVERECDWKHSRLLMEAKTEEDRHQKWAQIVKSLVNRYLFSEILRKWVPGTIIPEFKYPLWRKARNTMEESILAKANELRKERRDVDYLCTYAARFATEFFKEQSEILFDKTRSTPLSMDLKTRGKFTYVVALEKELAKRKDNRLAHVQGLVKEFQDGHYCLTNFVRMVENHQRYMIATTFTKVKLQYGPTFSLIKEDSADLMNPRYCYCEGTFCEGFGLATLIADRYQLIRLPDGTYKVVTNPTYKHTPLDPRVVTANSRIEQSVKNTYWHRHQKVPI